jgi:hypothetical protein
MLAECWQDSHLYLRKCQSKAASLFILRSDTRKGPFLDCLSSDNAAYVRIGRVTIRTVWRIALILLILSIKSSRSPAKITLTILNAVL